MWRTYIRGQTIIRFFNVQWTFAFLCFLIIFSSFLLFAGKRWSWATRIRTCTPCQWNEFTIVSFFSRRVVQKDFHTTWECFIRGSSLNDSRFPPLSFLLSNKINSSMERKNDVPPLDETANRFSFNKNFRSTIFLFIGHFTFSII